MPAALTAPELTGPDAVGPRSGVHRHAGKSAVIPTLRGRGGVVFLSACGEGWQDSRLGDRPLWVSSP